MGNNSIDATQGHWLLSKMGKRVLRPGGRELTLQMVEALKITRGNSVVEFAPGLGFTARKIMEKHPDSYTGIELNREAAERLSGKFKASNFRFINAAAGDVPLPNQISDKVFGEAMLTMQPDHRKREIISEAFRLLKPGGLYGIHELALHPETIDQQLKSTIKKALAQTVKINARPLTAGEWKNILVEEGFEIQTVLTGKMLLLEPKRILQDEGVFRTIKIGFNFLKHKDLGARLLKMRKVFRDYGNHLKAIVIIAQKPTSAPLIC